MLKQRILTAIVLVTVLLWCLFHSNPLYYHWLAGLTIFALGKEWVGLLTTNRSIIIVGAVLSVSIALSLNFVIGSNMIELKEVATVYCLLWLIPMIELLMYPRSLLYASRVIAVLHGIFTVGIFGYLLLAYRVDNGHAIALLSFLLLTWSSDTGAYFAGKAFGKHKMAPAMSPNKTWEGFLGGWLLVTGVLFTLKYFEWVSLSWRALILIGFMFHLGAVLGDLFQSILKRHRGVKDSGNLLPGHGGVFDRLDSFVVTLGLGIVLL